MFAEEEREPYGTPAFWTYAGLALCKLVDSNTFSLHLLCWTLQWLNCWLSLNRLVGSGTKTCVRHSSREKISQLGFFNHFLQAQVIFPILKRHHYLLVTLLLSNATAMEALPIFLDKLVPSFWAVMISVTMVLFFGEIIP